jgi:hypothetical protein
MNATVTRRRFIVSILSVSACLGAGVVIRVLTTENTEEEFVVKLSSVLGVQEDVVPVGRAIISECKDIESDPVVLIKKALPEWNTIDLTGEGSLLQAIREKIVQDFVDSRTRRVRKWLLSETEVYIIAALSAVNKAA